MIAPRLRKVHARIKCHVHNVGGGLRARWAELRGEDEDGQQVSALGEGLQHLVPYREVRVGDAELQVPPADPDVVEEVDRRQYELDGAPVGLGRRTLILRML